MAPQNGCESALIGIDASGMTTMPPYTKGIGIAPARCGTPRAINTAITARTALAPHPIVIWLFRDIPGDPFPSAPQRSPSQQLPMLFEHAPVHLECANGL